MNNINPNEPDKIGEAMWERIARHYEPSDDESWCKGTRRRIRSAAQFWEMAMEYFRWADDNPVPHAEKPRPYTWTAFDAFHAITPAQRWFENNPDIEECFKIVESIIYSQKFEYAMAGVYAQNIAVRDLNLADQVNTNQTHTHKGTLTEEQIDSLSKGTKKELLAMFKKTDEPPAE